MVPTDRWPLGSPGPASQASQILPDDAADRWLSWEEKKGIQNHTAAIANAVACSGGRSQ